MTRNPQSKLDRLMAKYAAEDSIAAKAKQYKLAKKYFRKWCAISDAICGMPFRIKTTNVIAL